MSSVLYLGGRLDSLETVGSVAETTSTSRVDTAYGDAAVSITGGSSNIVTARARDASNAATTLSGTQTGYFHIEHFIAAATFVGMVWWLEDSSGFPWLALRTTSTANVYGLYYNSGTGASPVWTLLGSTFNIPASPSPTHKYDIKLTLGSPHSATFYLNNVATTGTGTFTQASLTNIQTMRVGGDPSGGNNWCVSQMAMTEGISTINMHVKYSRGTGAGNGTGWTGGVTNVNEGINSDSTVDSATTAGLRQSYAMGDVTIPAGYVIKSVFHWLRAKNDGAAPQNIKSYVRQSTTNYDATNNIGGMGVGFNGVVERYDNDPSTGSPWTQTGFNAAEFGYLSVT